jgi:non-ribosomal peptide synthetase component E (peptide arylation enzyme)
VDDDEQMIQNTQGMSYERLDDIRVVPDHGNADDFHCPRHARRVY